MQSNQQSKIIKVNNQYKGIRWPKKAAASKAKKAKKAVKKVFSTKKKKKKH